MHSCISIDFLAKKQLVVLFMQKWLNCGHTVGYTGVLTGLGRVDFKYLRCIKYFSSPLWTSGGPESSFWVSGKGT